MGAGAPTKYPVLEIQRKIHTARDRSAKAAEIIDQVVAEGGDPEDAMLACESVRDNIQEAIQLIKRTHD